MRSLGRFWLALSLLSGTVMLCFASQQPKPLQLSPIAFETNRGQAPQKYSFLFHRDDLRAMFSANGVDLALCGKSGCNQKLALTFVGADSVPVSSSPLTGRANYFLGNDSSRWIRNIPLSSAIEYKDLYPGISLSFYGNGQELEHDFRIAPGADPARIHLRFDGASRVNLTSDGALEIHTSNGALTLRRPVAYQQAASNRTPVDAKFLLAADGSIQFRVGTYDNKRPLVIDPVIVFSSYLGGTGTDRAAAITTDASGNILVTGSTTSTDFPTVKPLQPSLGTNGQSVFVTKFDPTGKTLIYSTYLGGSGQALGSASASGGAIAVDSNGNAIVAGLTSSANFPIAGAGTSLSCQTNYDCFFLASLSPDGSTLNYSGMVGGEQGFSFFGTGVNLAVDISGNAYLAGTTDLSDFHITPGTLATSVTGYPYNETFVLKVDPTGALVYSTVIPGNDTNPTDLLQPYTNHFIPTGIAVDAAGDVTIAGTTGLGLPTTPGVVGPQFPNASVNVSNPSAGFVLQINPSASAINFASYLPGTDYNGGLAVGSTGNLYLVGGTGETDLPVSANAYQKTISPNSYGQYSAGYIMELNPLATAVVAATYVGSGSISTYGLSGVALDSHGDIFLGGYANSQNFPLQNPFVTMYEYSTTTGDMILAEIDPGLASLKFGSFFNPTIGVFAGSLFSSLAVDGSDNLVVAGVTNSTAFPTTSGSFEPQLPPPANPNSAPQHSFVAKFDMSTPAPAICFNTFNIDFGNVAANSSASQSLNVTNCGNAPLTISSAVSSDPTVVVSESCGTISAGASCSVSLSFTLVSSQGTTGTITFTDNAQTLPQSVSFAGQGIAPQIVASPNPLSFGHYVVGAKGVQAALMIQNHGQAPLTIANTAVTGAGFSIANNQCNQTLPSDSFCFVQLSFAPASTGPQNGSVILTSNDPVNPQFTIPLNGVGDATFAIPTITSIGAGTVQINNGSQTVQITGSNFYPESVVQVAGVTQTATFVSNTTLTAAVAASSLTAIGELPLTVVNPTPGGGTSSAATLTPYQTLPIGPSAVVSVPATGQLYAAIPASATSNANTVIPIDPTTGTLGTPIPVGNNPGLLAASSDGAFLYVANQGDFTLQRINLATNAVDRTFPYTPNIYCSSCTNLTATDLAAVPGNPTEVLLSQGSWLTLYNDAGAINHIPNDGICCMADPDFSSIALAGNPLTVYGLPFTYPSVYFQVASLTSSGLQYTRPKVGAYGNNNTGAQLVSDGTLLYTSAGQVWNPATQTQIATFPVTSINITSYPNMRALTLDTSLGEIYWVGFQSYWSPDSSMAAVISAYGMKSYALNGTLAFPQVGYPIMGDLVRWGSNGLAFVGAGAGQTDQELYLLRSSIVSSQNANPTPVLSSISPSSAIANGPQFTLTVDGSGFVSGSVIQWNQSPLATAFVSSQQLTATVPASDLAAAGTAQVTVLNPTPGGGSSAAATFTINTPAPPNPTPALSSLSPAFMSAGASAFQLTVHGSGFVSGSTVYWGSTALTTNFVDATQLTAQVPAAQIASAGTTAITVQSPAPGGGTSNAEQFEVDSAASGAGPTFSTTSASITPGATANYSVTLPASATNVSVTCLNLPKDATCSYSSSTGKLSITTSASTPKGTYVITAVFSETLPGAATALLLLPMLLRTRTKGARRSRRSRVCFLACAGIIILVGLAGNGCGGGSGNGNGGGGSPTPATHNVTSSGAVTLLVQ